jgi:hypothetical protein
VRGWIVEADQLLLEALVIEEVSKVPRVEQPARAMTRDTVAPQRPLALAGTGTGFVVSRRGHVLTAAHVAEGCDEMRVRLPSGVTSRVLSVKGGLGNRPGRCADTNIPRTPTAAGSWVSSGRPRPNSYR